MSFSCISSFKIKKYSFLFLIIISLLLFFFNSCNKPSDLPLTIDLEVLALDLSEVPKIESYNTLFYNNSSQAEDIISIAKNNDVSVIRIKLWKSPQDTNASFEQVKAFSQRIQSQGLKVWLTVHYSDTWADPAHQETPIDWQGISFAAIQDSVYNYTRKIVTEIQPEYIQIGNEINNGFLYPYGKIEIDESQFIALISTGIQAVRTSQNETKIIIHYAGIQGATSFYQKIATLDYDIIGLSYYPIWHGKDLQNLENTLSSLQSNYQKEVLIAETAYPFTLDWNDWTNNIVGLENQLILPDYPASFEGQKDFLQKIKQITQDIDGLGFCYWGAALVAFDGAQSTNASPWENQALFDFNNKVVPAMAVFNKD